MDQPPAAELQARIEALEARLKRHEEESRTAPSQGVSVVHAPFRVVDAAGHAILEVDSGPAGVHLRLLDKDGHFLVALMNTASGGSIGVYDGSGQEAVGIAAGRHGGNVGVNNEAGTLVAWMNVTESGGHVVARDNAGRITGLQSGSSPDPHEPPPGKQP